jgi:hypothetical protein
MIQSGIVAGSGICVARIEQDSCSATAAGFCVAGELAEKTAEENFF